MGYRIKKFIVNVYLRTHFKQAYALFRLMVFDDQHEFLDRTEWWNRYGRESVVLKRNIPDFVLDFYGLL